jgi:UDP-N-acetylglucosamine/UDP-N-acetylgalactosamine diphosphorylase
MDTKERFEQKGQGHVFQYWESLDQEEKKILQEQADEIDLDELGVLVSQLVFSKEGSSLIDFSNLDPAPYEPLPADIHGDEKWQEAKVAGEAALRSGRVAAFTVAGGQGTRLGYDGPKGTYPISPIKNKTLFQLFAEKIKAARCRYDCEIPWYLMTSHVNHEATISFFQENNHFGLGEGSVRFFRQGRMPAVDFEGKILMESKGSIAMSPDGHGGALRALERNGILDEMEAKGIDLMSYFQVDNPHVQVIDPYFLGFHVLSGSSMSSKMLPKAYEKEKLGHFCVLGNRLEIVEYSDMPDELTAQRDEKGQLRFIAGSVAIHIVSVDFIRKLTSKNSSIALPFHKALKKIACLDSNGEKIVPSEPNGVKFELFVFDALPFAGKPMIIETTRLGDFSPVKNAEGVDSAVTCRADQQRLFAQWLDEVGVSVEKDSEGVPLRKIEVSPLFGYNLETFRESWKKRGLKVDFSQDAYIE